MNCAPNTSAQNERGLYINTKIIIIHNSHENVLVLVREQVGQRFPCEQEM